MDTTTARCNGTLKKWNVERGFGFLVAEHGDQELFVHVLAFPRDGRQPALGETLTFQIELDRDQRKRAVRLQRPGAQKTAKAARAASLTQAQDLRAQRRTHSSSTSHSLATLLVAIALLAGLGWVGYFRYAAVSEGVGGVPQSFVGEAASVTPQRQQTAFRCDGRQHCSQMSSCEEAKFFLRSCPDPKMDGDGDGLPCEDQLCNGYFGN